MDKGSPVTLIYRLRADNTISYVGSGWREFAEHNDAPELMPAAVLDKPIDDYIDGADAQRLFALLFARVRNDNTRVTFPFRCDAPDRRRYCRMEMVPLDDDGIEMQSIVERVERREDISLLDRKLPRGADGVTICSWCRKVYSPQSGWVEVEQAIAEMDLMGREEQPRLSHSICPRCYTRANAQR
ncbi:hypothetical protein GF420_16485 [candidate division GN15 bacterium]|nr:hypothetical protein [candidate division GN15 bacterium]